MLRSDSEQGQTNFILSHPEASLEQTVSQEITCRKTPIYFHTLFGIV